MLDEWLEIVDASFPVGETPGLGDALARDELDLAPLEPPVKQREAGARGPTALAGLAGDVAEFRAVSEQLEYLLWCRSRN